MERDWSIGHDNNLMSDLSIAVVSVALTLTPLALCNIYMGPVKIPIPHFWVDVYTKSYSEPSCGFRASQNLEIFK